MKKLMILDTIRAIDYMNQTVFIIALLLLAVGCGSEPIRIGTETPDLPTPEISELSNNTNFHQNNIELTGYYYSEFEMSGLFERKRSDTDEAVWVNFSNELREQITDEQFQELLGRELRIQGTYNAKGRGHLMQYIGTIEVNFLEMLN